MRKYLIEVDHPKLPIIVNLYRQTKDDKGVYFTKEEADKLAKEYGEYYSVREATEEDFAIYGKPETIN